MIECESDRHTQRSQRFRKKQGGVKDSIGRERPMWWG